jgi:hypothetical protein
MSPVLPFLGGAPDSDEKLNLLALLFQDMTRLAVFAHKECVEAVDTIDRMKHAATKADRTEFVQKYRARDMDGAFRALDRAMSKIANPSIRFQDKTGALYADTKPAKRTP